LLDIELAGKGHLTGAGRGVFGVVQNLDKLFLTLRVVIDDELEWAKDSHGTGRVAVQLFALEVLKHFNVGGPVGARGADLGAEGAESLRRKAAAADATEGGHTGIVPAVDAVFLHKLEEFALAEQGVSEVETVELDLLRGKDAKLLDVPAIEGLVVSELQGAHGVSNALQRIRLAVGVVVHGIDAPLVAGALVCGVEDAIHDRIAHVQIR
jgi:hypothetical protein